MTPWDDDIDLFYFGDDNARLLDLKPDLAREGFGLAVFGHGCASAPLRARSRRSPPPRRSPFANLKLYPLDNFTSDMPPRRHRLEWRWPFFDLFRLDLVVESAIARLRKPGGEARDVPLHWLLPLRPVLYFDTVWLMPRRAEQLLESVYGRDWATSCVAPRYNHRIEGLDRDSNCDKTPCAVVQCAQLAAFVPFMHFRDMR